MAIRQILKGKDNERLRKKSREVSDISKRIKTLIGDMKETLKREEGVGLAAPQVGVLRRVIIVDFEDNMFEIINPVLTNIKGTTIENEGCLSLLPINGYVERPESVTVTGLNVKGEKISMDLSEMPARIVCHEVDHLEGVLFVDKVIPEDELDFEEED
jgi:peptide deformylase